MIFFVIILWSPILLYLAVCQGGDTCGYMCVMQCIYVCEPGTSKCLALRTIICKTHRVHMPTFTVWLVVIFIVCRSRSHSSDSSFEDDFGVRKEVLLHGTYDDYIKEYKSRSGGASGGSSSSKGQPSMADVAAAYQKALTQVASALQHQGSSSKVGRYHTHFSCSQGYSLSVHCLL